MIRLWGRPSSSNVMKVRWLLDEIELPYTPVATAPPDRAIGPTGLVPVLEDDGFALFESNAILRYLCNRHAPASPLYPSHAEARGTVDCWLDWQQTTLAPPMGIAFTSLVRQAPEQRDEAALMRALRQAGTAWEMLDARLQRQPYVAGATLTVADMAFGPHVHRWLNLPVARADAPALQAWYRRLQQRAPYVRHCVVELS